MIKEEKSKCYGALIACLIILINPNINTFDLLPDFIAWFMLAKIFTRAADSAAYFEEARVAFMRLGYISVAKIPALITVFAIRGLDSGDTDIFTLASVTFGVLELIFLIPAIKNIFEALFHLGQRTDAVSLISPFPLKADKNGKSNTAMTVPESVRGLTYLFFICKTVLCVLPDMLLLSSITDRGPVIKSLKYYPIAFLISMTVTVALGVKWFTVMKKYILAVKDEGLFFSALDEVATSDSAERFERKRRMRSIYFALTLLAVSSFASFELIFVNLKSINILPRTIYGIFSVFAVLKLSQHAKATKLPLISSILYTVSATLSYILHVSFYSRYEILDLIYEKEARTAYLAFEISAALEFAALAFMLVCAGLLLRSFLLQNTGVAVTDARYGRAEKEYHKALIKRAFILVTFGISAGAARLVSVILNYDVQIMFSDITDEIASPAFGASALPWFGLVVVALTVIYIGYSIYYTSLLKDEVEMKYSYQ